MCRRAKHSSDEQRQFVELTSRLIDQVDDATRAAVRARLAIYPDAPLEILHKLGVRPAQADAPMPMAKEIPSPPPARLAAEADDRSRERMASSLSMQPTDAARNLRDVRARQLQRARGDPA